MWRTTCLLLTYLTNKISENYNVYTAVDGQEAIWKLEKIPHLDLIVADIMMDRIDGFKMARIIKEGKKFSHVPLLFMTAKTRKADRLAGLGIGALDYIEKPFLLEELLLKINAILDNNDRQRHALVDRLYMLRDEAVDVLRHPLSNLEHNVQRYHLTEREVEIVRLLEREYDSGEISEMLHISKRTVTTHLQNIFKKTNVSSQAKLMKLLTSPEQ